MDIQMWEVGLGIPNTARIGEKKADGDAGLKAPTPLYNACARVVIHCARVGLQFPDAHMSHTTLTPQANLAACGNPAGVSDLSLLSLHGAAGWDDAPALNSTPGGWEPTPALLLCGRALAT